MVNVTSYDYRCRICRKTCTVPYEMTDIHSAQMNMCPNMDCGHYEPMHILINSHSVSAAETGTEGHLAVNNSAASGRSELVIGRAADTGSENGLGGTGYSGRQFGNRSGDHMGADSMVDERRSGVGNGSAARGTEPENDATQRNAAGVLDPSASPTAAVSFRRSTTLNGPSATRYSSPPAPVFRNGFNGRNEQMLDQGSFGYQNRNGYPDDRNGFNNELAVSNFQNFAETNEPSTSSGYRGLQSLWSSNRPPAPTAATSPTTGGIGWGRRPGGIVPGVPFRGGHGGQPFTTNPIGPFPSGAPPTQNRRRTVPLPIVRRTATFQVHLFRKMEGNKMPVEENGPVGRETRLMLFLENVKTVFFQEDSHAGVQSTICSAFPQLRQTGWKIISRHPGKKRQKPKGDDLFDTDMTEGWNMEALKSVAETVDPGSHAWIFVAPRHRNLSISREVLETFAAMEMCDIEQFVDAPPARAIIVTRLMPTSGQKRSLSPDVGSPIRSRRAAVRSNDLVSEDEDDDVVLVSRERVSLVAASGRAGNNVRPVTNSASSRDPITLPDIIEIPQISIRSEPLPKRDHRDTRTGTEIRRGITVAVLGLELPLQSDLTFRMTNDEAVIRDFVRFHAENGSFENMRRPFRVKIDEAFDLGGPRREFYGELWHLFFNYKVPEFGDLTAWETNGGITMPRNRNVQQEQTQRMYEAFGGALWNGIFHQNGFPAWIWNGCLRWMISVPYVRGDIYKWSPVIGKMVDKILAEHGTLDRETLEEVEEWIDGAEGFPRFLLTAPRPMLAEQIVDFEMITKRLPIFQLIKKGFMKGSTEAVLSCYRADWVMLEAEIYRRVETAAELLEQFMPRPPGNPQRHEIFEWLEDSIVSVWSPDDRRKFLRFVTGADFIPVINRIHVEFIDSSGRNYVPAANTCFSLLKLGSGYENKAGFTGALEYALANFENPDNPDPLRRFQDY